MTIEDAGRFVRVQDAWSLPAVAGFPRYDRAQRGCAVAHLGVGNFHRAHQALFLHEYLQQRPEDWMIHGVSLLPSDRDLVRAMHAQGNLYTLTERSGARDTIRVVGAIQAVTHAPADPLAVVRLLAARAIQIVSLTITEKGYYYNVARDLDLDHPVVRADLTPHAVPQSALGYLCAAARARMIHRGAPFTVVSCDNLPGNGDLTRRLLLQFADRKDAAVGAWIRANVAFPNSMVDRITPAVSAATRAFVRDAFGIDDQCPVISEAFRQWVIEDRFAGGRPPLETVGVQFVERTEPYEVLKVRLLNGTHSALAYPAYLMGWRTVDGALADPLLRRFVQRYMEEDITPTIPAVPGIDVPAYRAQLLERFANPAISDQVQRLAQDGSQKIRNAIVPPLVQQWAAGGSITWIAFALAAWYRYLRGVDEHGAPIAIDDPLRETLCERARLGPGDPTGLLSLQEVFGPDLAGPSRVSQAVKAQLDAIDQLGTRAALGRLLAQ